ncbi:MAG TPA: hypothetical protein VHM67_13565, partial [Gemmatimonadaceae bacterium]|nr:hypothetical protein [Gemmatimonadaceae bacterium]
TPHQCVVMRARVAFEEVALHPDQIDPWQQVVDEGDVIPAKLSAVHRLVLPLGTAKVPDSSCQLPAAGYHPRQQYV